MNDLAQHLGDGMLMAGRPVMDATAMPRASLPAPRLVMEENRRCCTSVTLLWRCCELVESRRSGDSQPCGASSDASLPCVELKVHCHPSASFHSWNPAKTDTICGGSREQSFTLTRDAANRFH